MEDAIDWENKEEVVSSKPVEDEKEDIGEEVDYSAD